jgi:hypothetical protein
MILSSPEEVSSAIKQAGKATAVGLRTLNPYMKLRLAGTAKRLNVERPTSNVEY